MSSSDSSDYEDETKGQRNVRRLGRAQRRGLRLTSVHPRGLKSPVDLRLNSHGLYDIQALISGLVKLSFALGMNSPGSPVVDLPYQLFERITELNKFIYGNILSRYSLDNSNMLHMTQQMPMLAPPATTGDDTSSQIKAAIRESDNKSDYFDNLRVLNSIRNSEGKSPLNETYLNVLVNAYPNFIPPVDVGPSLSPQPEEPSPENDGPPPGCTGGRSRRKRRSKTRRRKR